IPGRDLAGKTGTTSDYRDAWFAGYTGGVVAVVWLGRDDNRPMTGVTGGGLPADVWRTVMTTALKRLPAGPIPPGPATPPPPAEPTPEAPVEVETEGAVSPSEPSAGSPPEPGPGRETDPGRP
ncbi:MAG: penicillin-binding protein, partial [Phenylobacterium sp.]